jgi:hypothetical protein
VRKLRFEHDAKYMDQWVGVNRFTSSGENSPVHTIDGRSEGVNLVCRPDYKRWSRADVVRRERVRDAARHVHETRRCDVAFCAGSVARRVAAITVFGQRL